MPDKESAAAAKRNDHIRKTLEKQLQLLSERSREDDVSISDLCVLTHSMAELLSIATDPVRWF